MLIPPKSVNTATPALSKQCSVCSCIQTDTFAQAVMLGRDYLYLFVFEKTGIQKSLQKFYTSV